MISVNGLLRGSPLKGPFFIAKLALILISWLDTLAGNRPIALIYHTSVANCRGAAMQIRNYQNKSENRRKLTLSLLMVFIMISSTTISLLAVQPASQEDTPSFSIAADRDSAPRWRSLRARYLGWLQSVTTSTTPCSLRYNVDRSWRCFRRN